jgi:peroxiredoxin
MKFTPLLTRRVVAIALAITSFLWLSAGCQKSPEGQSAKPPPATVSLAEFLKPFKGKTLVLLLGREGCPGTIKATGDLSAWQDKPANLEIVRLDVPLPNEKLVLHETWDRPFPRKIDEGRQIAGQLEFFFYPTLYLFDPDGDLRFTGGCDTAKLAAMAKEIAAATPGQPKKSFSLPMPAIGTPAPAFAASDLAGTPVELKTLAGKTGTLLVFAKTACGFTVEALPAVKILADAYRKDNVAVIIINSGEEQDKIRGIYDKAAPGVPVVWDRDGEISKAYGVETAPFCFLLDKEAKVVARRPFVPATANRDLANQTGRTSEAPLFKPTEAG